MRGRKDSQSCRGGGRGAVTHESFTEGGSALSSKPLPFDLPLLTGRVTLSYTFYRRWYSFHIPSVETHYLFFVGSVQDTLKGLFKYLNDSFCYPFLYFSSWNPYPLIYLYPERGTPFSRSLPAESIIRSIAPPPSQESCFAYHSLPLTRLTVHTQNNLHSK